MSLRRALFAVALGGLVPACNPYQNFTGDFYAGPIDPTNFAAAYVGTEPGTPDQSGGKIDPLAASAAGAPINYYLFPFSAAQTAAHADGSDPTPLSLGSENLAAADAYVFDPTASSAFPSPSKCVAPKNYVFDQRTEAYRHDEQGNIFTDLPDDPSYVPVIAENAVTSQGEKCQSIISAKDVNAKRKDISVGSEDGKYLAFAVLDPGVDVSPEDPATGLGPVHWGFYNQFLLAYMDGGYIPTVHVAASGSGTSMVAAHDDMVTQKIYIPNSFPGTTIDPNDPTMMNMIPTTCPTKDPNATCPSGTGPDGEGTGYDILDAARGDAGYSPVCEVWTYDPDVDQNGIPTPEADSTLLSPTEQASATATGTYIFCFQVAQ